MPADITKDATDITLKSFCIVIEANKKPPRSAQVREPLAVCVRRRLSYSSEAKFGTGLETKAEFVSGAERDLTVERTAADTSFAGELNFVFASIRKDYTLSLHDALPI